MNVDPHSIESTVARIEAKLDQALTNQTDHETRLRQLEVDGNQSKGAAARTAVIAAFIGGMIPFAWEFIKSIFSTKSGHQ